MFSKLDFTQFYHQLPLLPEERHKTAFFADGQLWEYTLIPFGLKNGVAACSRIMNAILADVSGCVVYLDDILIHGETVEEHDKALNQVLERIRKHGLSLNKEKCTFHTNEAGFVGFRLSQGNIKPDRDRLEGVLAFPFPKSLSHLERFIGLANYFSKFIDRFSDIVKPLYDLKHSLLQHSDRKNDPYIKQPSVSCSNAFQSIKNALCDAVLTIPSANDELILRTDA